MDLEIVKEVGIAIGAGLSGFILNVIKHKKAQNKNYTGQERRILPTIDEGCPDPICHNEVLNTSSNVRELKEKFNNLEKDIYPKINTTAQDVAAIKGFLKGSSGRSW